MQNAELKFGKNIILTLRYVFTKGNTALHYAATKGYLKSTAALLGSGASTEIENLVCFYVP